MFHEVIGIKGFHEMVCYLMIHTVRMCEHGESMGVSLVHDPYDVYTVVAT